MTKELPRAFVVLGIVGAAIGLVLPSVRDRSDDRAAIRCLEAVAEKVRAAGAEAAPATRSALERAIDECGDRIADGTVSAGYPERAVEVFVTSHSDRRFQWTPGAVVTQVD